MLAIKIPKLRIKDKHARVRGRMAREVHRVFNFCNETSVRAIRERHPWLSGYDLQKPTAGDRCEGVTVGSGTVQLVCAEDATRRRQFKKTRLNGCVSNPKSVKYSLGWIAFKGGHAKHKAKQVEFAGQKFSLWDGDGLSKFELHAGSLSPDARGCGYRASEKARVTAQRAKKKGRVRAIHAQVKNQRKDALHPFSTQLVRENATIFVGDVASAKLVKTQMAKSTLDAGWTLFKMVLEYKRHQAGVVFGAGNEAHSSQTCSSCARVEGAKGFSGLGIRQWTCRCGAIHDRDVNAARNMAARGLARLAEGTPA